MSLKNKVSPLLLGCYLITLIVSTSKAAAVLGLANEGSQSRIDAAKQNGRLETLEFFGAVDGKSYFGVVETAFNKNWNDAKAYCESVNMGMASIENIAQANMLIQNMPKNRLYWSGLRESRSPSMLVWDDSESGYNPVPGLLTLVWDTPAYQYLGAIRVNANSITMFLDSSRGVNLRSVLCQV